MSKKCMLCQYSNEDSSTVCNNCNMPFEQERIVLVSNQPISCDSIGNQSIGGETIAQHAQWFIKCPLCDREYSVPDENARIEECTYHDRPIKRQKIRNEEPYRKDIDVQEACIEANEETNIEAKLEANIEANALKPKALALMLKHIPTGKIIRFDGDGIIGREGTHEPEFFANNLEVSRKHCIIERKNDGYTIRHIGLNDTRIGRRKLRKNESAILGEDQILTIADITFAVSIDWQ